MLHRISEFEINKMSISTYKDATYLQSDKQPFEIQTEWITLGQYPLPSKKYITDEAKSLNLTAPTDNNDNNYILLSAIDESFRKLKYYQKRNTRITVRIRIPYNFQKHILKGRLTNSPIPNKSNGFFVNMPYK